MIFNDINLPHWGRSLCLFGPPACIRVTIDDLTEQGPRNERGLLPNAMAPAENSFPFPPDGESYNTQFPLVFVWCQAWNQRTWLSINSPQTHFNSTVQPMKYLIFSWLPLPQSMLILKLINPYHHHLMVVVPRGVQKEACVYCTRKACSHFNTTHSPSSRLSLLPFFFIPEWHVAVLIPFISLWNSWYHETTTSNSLRLLLASKKVVQCIRNPSRVEGKRNDKIASNLSKRTSIRP